MSVWKPENPYNYQDAFESRVAYWEGIRDAQRKLAEWLLSICLEHNHLFAKNRIGCHKCVEALRREVGL